MSDKEVKEMMVNVEIFNRIDRQGNTPETSEFYAILKEAFKNQELELNKTNITKACKKYNSEKIVKNKMGKVNINYVLQYLK